MVNEIILPLLTGIVCGLPSAFSKEVKKPNVIVIIVDDLGSGDVSCLLRDVVKTPNIDRLAKSDLVAKMKEKWEQWFSQMPERKTERQIGFRKEFTHGEIEPSFNR